jgi:hypothetical protein
MQYPVKRELKAQARYMSFLVSQSGRRYSFRSSILKMLIWELTTDSL